MNASSSDEEGILHLSGQLGQSFIVPRFVFSRNKKIYSIFQDTRKFKFLFYFFIKKYRKFKIKFCKKMLLPLLCFSILLLAGPFMGTLATHGHGQSSSTTTTSARPPAPPSPPRRNNGGNSSSAVQAQAVPNSGGQAAVAGASSPQLVQFQQANGNNCPPLLGQNFPSRQTQTLNVQGQSQVCQWVIISDRRNCPQFFQNCGPNQPMCNRQNEIWWQCTTDCEPSCGNPTPNCRQRCGRSGCQCFPGFLRSQDGVCVPSDQCSPGNDECSGDNDCPGNSNICQDNQCREGCTSNGQCANDEECSSGRCVERSNCRRDSQCRGSKICFNQRCRLISSFFCRNHFDCPGQSFCGRNGRCFDPFRAFEDDATAVMNNFFRA